MFGQKPTTLRPGVTLAHAQDDFTRRANLKIAEERGIREGEERRVPSYPDEPPRVLDDDEVVPLADDSVHFPAAFAVPDMAVELGIVDAEPTRARPETFHSPTRSTAAPDAWVDEARAAVELLTRLIDERRIVLRGRVRTDVEALEGGTLLPFCLLRTTRLVPRTVYDEEDLS